MVILIAHLAFFQIPLNRTHVVLRTQRTCVLFENFDCDNHSVAYKMIAWLAHEWYKTERGWNCSGKRSPSTRMRINGSRLVALGSSFASEVPERERKRKSMIPTGSRYFFNSIHLLFAKSHYYEMITMIIDSAEEIARYLSLGRNRLIELQMKGTYWMKKLSIQSWRWETICTDQQLSIWKEWTHLVFERQMCEHTHSPCSAQKK